MGRYYSGDISGKFWFAVQSSDDASYFGGTTIEPNTITYNFDTDDMPDIKKGIANCEKELRKYKTKLDKFFKEENGYNDKILSDYLKVKESQVHNLLQWYARLELGIKIRDCVEKNGFCEFEAEC